MKKHYLHSDLRRHAGQSHKKRTMKKTRLTNDEIVRDILSAREYATTNWKSNRDMIDAINLEIRILKRQVDELTARLETFGARGNL